MLVIFKVCFNRFQFNIQRLILQIFKGGKYRGESNTFSTNNDIFININKDKIN